MMPIYCFTGCDTVSSFFGKGKALAFRIMMTESENYQDLATVGTHEGVTKTEVNAFRRLVYRMYGHSGLSLNDVRGEMSERVDHKTVGKRLPPTEDSFELHVLRACLQLSVWKKADIALSEPLDPTQYGYEHVDGKLKPKLMNQGITAPELQNDLFCSCSEGSCGLGSCTCYKHNQPCTAVCKCKACLPEETDEYTIWCTNPCTLESVLAGIVLLDIP